MQPPFDITGDLDTPVSAFMKLAPFRPRFLLESVEGGEKWGRYTFLGSEPSMVLRARGVLLDASIRRELDEIHHALVTTPLSVGSET